MCGIAGFVDLGNSVSRADALTKLVQEMARELEHRGPDDQGAWVDAAAGVALGFQRLAILDLTVAGHQPMRSASDRYVLAFNGEVYNHLDIRTKLLNERSELCFRGHSDTEVLLAAIDAWGLQAAVKECVGMFAIALWDRQTRHLSLARDRMGEKPLYYARFRDVVLFGSELKALRRHPQFRASICQHALALYMRHGYIPAPYTIYRGVYKLLPGTTLTVSQSTLRTGDLPEPTPYWSLREVALAGRAKPYSGSDFDACNELERLLQQAVHHQMIADVPVGAFLSGGIDSSLIVALMQQTSRRTRTFSIGFEEPAYNESVFAEQIASHLQTDHTRLTVTAADAQAVIPEMPRIYDEPFADSSQIPTYLVARLARQQVTVALSGDGGDELFQGYTRYACNRTVWNQVRYLPRPLRRLLSRCLDRVPSSRVDDLANWLKRAAGSTSQLCLSARLRRLAEVLVEPTFESQYRASISTFRDPENVVLGSQELLTSLTNQHAWPPLSDVGRRMQYFDTLMYLPDDILTKVDRATMAVSLESRIPMLDHRVVEFAWRLPPDMLTRQGKGKWILRQLLHRFVPDRLVDRPKMGFGIPLGEWLRGPLRPWAEEYLSVDRLRTTGFFAVERIRRKWDQHVSGNTNWQYALWNVLMFQSWHEANHSRSLSLAA